MQEKEQLKGIAKILDHLWGNSYHSKGKRGSDRIKEEMIYFFGEEWNKDMYNFIEHNGKRPEMPRPLKDIKN